MNECVWLNDISLYMHACMWIWHIIVSNYVYLCTPQNVCLLPCACVCLSVSLSLYVCACKCVFRVKSFIFMLQSFEVDFDSLGCACHLENFIHYFGLYTDVLTSSDQKYKSYFPKKRRQNANIIRLVRWVSVFVSLLVSFNFDYWSNSPNIHTVHWLRVTAI